MERLFDLDAQLLNDAVLLAIAVFFLFLIMSNMLFNPARKLLKDRKEGIAKDIADAKNDKEEAEKLKAEYEAKLKDISKESKTILKLESDSKDLLEYIQKQLSIRFIFLGRHNSGKTSLIKSFLGSDILQTSAQECTMAGF